MKRSYRIAIVCGAAPLLLGIAIFLLWIATRWVGLMVVGVYAIYLGLALFIIGLIALGRFWWLAARTRALPRAQMWGDVLTALVLLLANFPLAWGIVGAVVALETRYLVVVRNDSPQPLTQIRLAGGGASAAIFSIAPQSSAERSLWFRGDGELRFEATLNAKKVTGVVQPYVTNGGGGRAAVLVDAAGTVAVTHPRKP